MRAILFTLLLATLTFAQTGRECTLRDGTVVSDGWNGLDSGDNFCNRCWCTNGALRCTLMACLSKSMKLFEECRETSECNEGLLCVENSCKEIVITLPKIAPQLKCSLTGGETVSAGWVGKDTGAAFCNDCICMAGKLMCTREECCPTDCINSKCDNGILVTKEGQCCAECVPIPRPSTQPPIPISQSSALECGDMIHERCDMIPWCLWLVKEKECDEIKEMDCQDLDEHACGEALECAWIFDDRFLCLEKKEVESMEQSQFPPVRKPNNSGKIKSGSESDIPAWQLLVVLVIFMCLGCSLTRAFVNSLKKHDTKTLLFGEQYTQV